MATSLMIIQHVCDVNLEAVSEKLEENPELLMT